MGGHSTPGRRVCQGFETFGHPWDPGLARALSTSRAIGVQTSAVLSKGHSGGGPGGRRRAEKEKGAGPPGRKPVAPPVRVEKPAKRYDRRDEERDVNEGIEEETKG